MQFLGGIRGTGANRESECDASCHAVRTPGLRPNSGIFPAWLANTAPQSPSATQELARRLWQAQVAVLFPAIEEYRHFFLNQLRGHLQVPYRTPYGEITELAALELGHIESQVNERNLPLATGQRNLLKRLRHMRNQLAHMQPLTVDDFTL